MTASMAPPVRRRTRPAEVPTFAAAALVGLATAPFVGIYTLVLSVPVGAVTWFLSRRRPGGAARPVAVAAAGLIAGVAVYLAVALVVSAFGAAPGSGSGSG